jgi:hypothetical protein
MSFFMQNKKLNTAKKSSIKFNRFLHICQKKAKEQSAFYFKKNQ